MVLSRFSYLLLVLSFAVMLLHNLVPHHHHNSEAHQHSHHNSDSGEHEHSHDPLSHPDHADFTSSLASRYVIPEANLTKLQITALTFSTLFSVADFFIVAERKRPPDILIRTLFIHRFSGLRAPPSAIA